MNTKTRMFAGIATIGLITSFFAAPSEANAQSWIERRLKDIERTFEQVGGIQQAFSRDGVATNSCNTTAGIGAAVGGEIFGGGEIGQIGGALAATAICNSVKLKGVKKDDVPEVSEVTEELLKQENSGTVTIESSREKGKRYVVETSDAVATPVTQQLTLLEDVEEPEDNSKIASEFYVVKVNSSLNVRAGPSTKAEKTGYFENGDIVQVISISPDGQWALIGSLGVGVGYVSTQFIQQAEAGTQISSVSRPKQPEERITAQRARAEQKRQAGEDVAKGPAVKTVEKVVIAPCKSVRINNRDNGTACKLAAGGVQWGKNNAS